MAGMAVKQDGSEDDDRIVRNRRNCSLYAAEHCNTLQHTATLCNTLRHTATHRNTLQHAATQYLDVNEENECVGTLYQKQRTLNYI